MSIGHSRSRIFCSNSSRKFADRFRLSLHEELDHFLEEDALELFQPARFQRAAFDDDLAVAGEERVVLRLVAEHRLELLVEFDLDAGRQFFGQCLAQFIGVRVRRRDEINAVGVDLDDLRAARVQPVDHLLQKLAADLGDARGRVEIGEVSLGETEVAVEAVDQDLEGVLEGVEILLLLRDLSRRACSPSLRAGTCADR